MFVIIKGIIATVDFRGVLKF